MGRPEFETVVASAPREYVERVNIFNTASTNILKGTASMFAYYAPAGYVGEVESLSVNIDALVSPATTGTHEVWVGYSNVYSSKGIATWNKKIGFNFGCWTDADVLQLPPSNQTQFSAIKGWQFDDTNLPFQVTYYNNSDASQRGAVSIWAVIRFRQVAK